jgi:hypothetical protein
MGIPERCIRCARCNAIFHKLCVNEYSHFVSNNCRGFCATTFFLLFGSVHTITIRQINSILSMRDDCEMRAALSFDAEGMSVFYVLTAVGEIECKYIENAIEISKEIMQNTEITIGLFCMDQESEQTTTKEKKRTKMA